MNLSVAVMAHRKREHLIPALLAGLGIGEEHVVWDTTNNRWDTGRRAMAAYDPAADWHMVVQDDVIVCADFIEGMTKALEHVPPERIVQPYVGTRRPLQGYVMEVIAKADEIGASWLEMRALMWGTVIIVPTWTIDDMLVWCDRRAWPNYDKRVGQYYYAKLAWSTYYTWPSLSDHMDPDRDGEPSIVGHGGGRVAHRFAGRETSALSFDWSGPVAQMRGLAQLQRRREGYRTARNGSARSGPSSMRGRP